MGKHSKQRRSLVGVIRPALASGAPQLEIISKSCACNKDKNRDNGQVNIRIENGTNLMLEDVTIANAVYGDVSLSDKTEYSVVTEPIYAGYCNFKIGEREVYAGYGICGTPPLPPPFGPGYYTFRVEPAGTGYFTVIVKND